MALLCTALVNEAGLNATSSGEVCSDLADSDDGGARRRRTEEEDASGPTPAPTASSAVVEISAVLAIEVRSERRRSPRGVPHSTTSKPR